MSSQDSNPRQPDPYAIRSILGGEVFSIEYAPNDEERSARAAKSRAEANKLQAEADDLKLRGRWWAFLLGLSYLASYGGIFVFGCFLGTFFF